MHTPPFVLASVQGAGCRAWWGVHVRFLVWLRPGVVPTGGWMGTISVRLSVV